MQSMQMHQSLSPEFLLIFSINENDKCLKYTTFELTGAWIPLGAWSENMGVKLIGNQPIF